MTKVLVTGGAGFIGSHVVDKLIERGHDVIIVDNLSTGRREYINLRAKFYNLDITENIIDIFRREKPEIVIHMAAQVQLRNSLEDPLYDAKTNILGTICVLEACKKSNVRKIIYTSTGGARVGNPEYLPVDEKHPINPISPYGISKHAAEHYVIMYAKLYNLEYLILCFGNVYGPRDDPSNKRIISIFINQMLRNEQPKIFGDGEQTRDFIYVKDLAELMINNLDSITENKLFHLANGEQVNMNKIFEILKNLLNYEGNAQNIEAIPGEVRDIVLDITLSKKELNWSPKYPIEIGLKETVEWFKRNKFD